MNNGGVIRFRPVVVLGVGGRFAGYGNERKWHYVTHKRNKEGTWRYEHPRTHELSEVFSSKEACMEAAQGITDAWKAQYIVEHGTN